MEKNNSVYLLFKITALVRRCTLDASSPEKNAILSITEIPDIYNMSEEMIDLFSDPSDNPKRKEALIETLKSNERKKVKTCFIILNKDGDVLLNNIDGSMDFSILKRIFCMYKDDACIVKADKRILDEKDKLIGGRILILSTIYPNSIIPDIEIIKK